MSSAPGRAVGAPSAGLSQFRGAESCRRVTTRVHSGRRLLVPPPTVCRSDVRRACRAVHRRSLLARRGQRQSGATRTARDPSAASASATTTASSRSSPAPCARSRRRSSAAPVKPSGAHQVPGRRAAGARGARPGQGRHDEHRGASAPSSSSGSTGSPRSWPRPPPATPRCSRCSPRTPSSPTRPGAQARDADAPPASRRPPEEADATRARRPTRRRPSAGSCRSR